MRNTLHGLEHLNTWSPVDAVWGGSGGVALLQEVCSWGQALRVKDSCHFKLPLSALGLGFKR